MRDTGLLHLQYAAGLVLQELIEVLQISREDFSDVLARFLSAGKETESEEGKEQEQEKRKEKKKKKKGTSASTVLGYFKKLPQKYFDRDDRYELFKMIIENTVYEFCTGNVSCIIDGDIISDRWDKHGEEILRQLDEVHRKAKEARSHAITLEIEKLLSD
ncbi:MAG: hypothetical protein K2M42_02070 [Oscillospiraceae bacterium]|nr:hypothetical protein [Oscillospiraceae bacterium]